MTHGATSPCRNLWIVPHQGMDASRFSSRLLSCVWQGRREQKHETRRPVGPGSGRQASVWSHITSSQLAASQRRRAPNSSHYASWRDAWLSPAVTISASRWTLPRASGIVSGTFQYHRSNDPYDVFVLQQRFRSWAQHEKRPGHERNQEHLNLFFFVSGR
jgi:hypothetical protein